MNQILDKIIGTYTDDNKKRVISILREIKDKYSSISHLDLKDENYFKENTLEFKKKIQNGKSTRFRSSKYGRRNGQIRSRI